MKVVFPPLYAIMDASLLSVPVRELALTLARAGVELIQYRNKQIPSRGLYQISSELASLLRPHGVRFVLNDRPDIAVLAGAGGAHVGQNDLGVAEARRLCPSPLWVGISTHTLVEVRAADRTDADYLAFGPVFPTTTKGEPEPVVGLELLRQARALTGKPFVAIGGITRETAVEVYRAGADCVAVARELVGAPDPGERASTFLRLAREAGKAC